MKLIVCGGRDYEDKMTVWSTLDRIAGCEGDTPIPTIPITIVHGDCGRVEVRDGKKVVVGADWLAREWAVCNWCNDVPYPANWTLHGRAAGPIRNQQMIDENRDADMLIAFPGGRGTADCLRRARAAGIKVVDITTSHSGTSPQQPGSQARPQS